MNGCDRMREATWAGDLRDSRAQETVLFLRGALRDNMNGLFSAFNVVSALN
jgi:hypothetical protein